MAFINQSLPDHEFRHPVEEIPQPVGTGTKNINRLKQLINRLKPVDQPVEEFAHPVEGISQPVEEFSQPVEGMAQPGVYFLNQLLPVEKFLIRYSLF